MEENYAPTAERIQTVLEKVKFFLKNKDLE